MSILASLAFSALRRYSRVAPTERGGYRLMRLARRLLPMGQWQGTFTTPDGISLSLDLGTYPDCCMAVGLYELDTYRQMVRILKPGMWFVDCGANVGYFSLLAAKRVGENGRVDAFEPDPVNRARMEAHLHDNGMVSRVHVHPVALTDQASTLQLYHPAADRGNHGMASLYHSLVPTGEQYTIEAVRLDECIDGVPDLIKMDIEGAELAAIGGMSEVLASPQPPQLIIEHNPVSCAAAGYSPGDLFRKLMTIQPQYQIYWIGWRLHRIGSPEALDAIRRQGNLLVRKAS